jgi:hypothetical protein
MAHVPTFPRRLFMHPAHRTVGVLGCRSALEAYRPGEDLPLADADTQPREDEDWKPEIGEPEEELD